MLHLEGTLSEKKETLLIKRCASRRLSSTETSDYVTLEDIAKFLHEGRDVRILDLKSGDDLTRQYLLQIIAEHESRGESVLPIDVLTDLVRSYTTQATSVVPQFLEMSFEMLREGQQKMLENISSSNTLPGFEAIKAQQEAFLAAFSNGFGNWPMQTSSKEGTAGDEVNNKAEELDSIKKQLSDLQEQLRKMNK